MRHAFNGREQRVEGFKVDGVTEEGTVLKFHGCFLHAMKRVTCATINPVSGLTMQELGGKTRLKTDTLRSKGIEK